MLRARRRRWWIAGAAAAAVVVGAALGFGSGLFGPGLVATPPAQAASAAPSSTDASGQIPVVDPAGLPEARYDAVIGGLLPFAGSADVIEGTSSITRDVALYGADKRTPVARLAAVDFLGEPTTVVVAGEDGGWSLVLTPARVSLPSASAGNAPAQSAGWVPSSELTKVEDPAERVVISVGRQSLSIIAGDAVVAEFTVGVGAPGTPTPTNVTGYLQQRYADSAQGTGDHPIQLTSLHASAQDEPYEGTDGGLIGLHYSLAPSGEVSHGCIRLTAEAIAAVDELPLGIPVTIVP